MLDFLKCKLKFDYLGGKLWKTSTFKFGKLNLKFWTTRQLRIGKFESFIQLSKDLINIHAEI